MAICLSSIGVRPRIAVVALAALLLTGACSPAESPTASPSGAALASAEPSQGDGVIIGTPAPTGTAAGPTADPTPTAAPTNAPKPRAAKWNRAGRWLTQGSNLSFTDYAALGDGRVLGVGGDWGGDITVPVAQVWDPATKRAQAVEALPKYRESFAMVGLPDGRVLVVGGRNANGDAYSSAYVFDPATERWTKTGLMHTARTSPAVAVLPDGRVLVAGGHYETAIGLTAPAPVTATLASWTPPSAAPPVPLEDVDVPPRGRALATAEIWDPRTGTWDETGSMRYARTGAVAATLADGRVLVAGATWQNTKQVDDRAYTTAEIWDPATGRFTSAGGLPDLDRDSLPKAVRKIVPDGTGNYPAPGSLVALPDGGALLVGWSDGWKHWGSVSGSFRYGAKAGQWRQVGKTFAFFETEHGDAYTEGTPDFSQAAVVALPGGRVLVAGGNEFVKQEGEDWHYAWPTARAWMFDPARGRFVKLPNMPVARFGGVGVGQPDGSVLLVDGNSPVLEDGEWEASGQPPVVRFVPPVP